MESKESRGKTVGKVSRRGFLKGAAVVVGTVALGGLTEQLAQADGTATPTPTGTPDVLRKAQAELATAQAKLDQQRAVATINAKSTAVKKESDALTTPSSTPSVTPSVTPSSTPSTTPTPPSTPDVHATINVLDKAAIQEVANRKETATAKAILSATPIPNLVPSGGASLPGIENADLVNTGKTVATVVGSAAIGGGIVSQLGRIRRIGSRIRNRIRPTPATTAGGGTTPAGGTGTTP